MRALSARKLEEVEALLERTKAVKGWLEVAAECGCATPDECSLFTDPGAATIDRESVLRVIPAGSCRRG